MCQKWASLPCRVQENHRRKSLDALRDEVWLSRQVDQKVATRLIENLSSCENGLTNFRLNSLAYARHSANYRRAHIDEAFRDLDVEEMCSRVASSEHFREYLVADQRTAGLLDAELGAIDDLAERRNEIAHGTPSQILNREELSEYLDFFSTFARACFLVLRQHLAQYAVGHHARPLGAIAKVHYRSVVCLDLGVLPEGTWLEVGDLIALRMASGRGFELGEIKRIRQSSGDVASLRSEKGLEVCLETDLRLREKMDLFLLSRDNTTVIALSRPLP